MGEKLFTVDDRCRITLGTRQVSPGDRFILRKSDDGTIVLTPVRVETW